jgi:hypothetical protein
MLLGCQGEKRTTVLREWATTSPMPIHAALEARRLRSPDTFCANASRSLRFESVDLLRHFTSLCR